MASVEERVVDIVAEQLGVEKDKVNRETHFVNDLGAGSQLEPPSQRNQLRVVQVKDRRGSSLAGPSTRSPYRFQTGPDEQASLCLAGPQRADVNAVDCLVFLAVVQHKMNLIPSFHQ